jgi:hypothetical protein
MEDEEVREIYGGVFSVAEMEGTIDQGLKIDLHGLTQAVNFLLFRKGI